jgi:hypothetical protein
MDYYKKYNKYKNKYIELKNNIIYQYGGKHELKWESNDGLPNYDRVILIKSDGSRLNLHNNTCILFDHIINFRTIPSTHTLIPTIKRDIARIDGFKFSIGGPPKNIIYSIWNSEKRKWEKNDSKFLINLQDFDSAIITNCPDKF